MCSNLSNEILSCFVFLFPDNLILGSVEDFKASFLVKLPCLVAKRFSLFFFAGVCLFLCLHRFTTSTVRKISTPAAIILLMVTVITISCDNPADEVVTSGGGTSETVVDMSELKVDRGSETVVDMSELMDDEVVVKPIM